MAKAKGNVPAIRVYIHDRQLRFSGNAHNIDILAVHEVDYIAGYFYDDPTRPGLYVRTIGGDLDNLYELLVEMDVINGSYG